MGDIDDLLRTVVRLLMVVSVSFGDCEDRSLPR
jgi:hypothetical protein